MDEPFLMGVLDGIANLQKQREAVGERDFLCWSQYWVILMPLTNSITK